MGDTAIGNVQWARRLVGGLAAAGVTDAVLSPGARSTPLAIALFEHPRMRARVQVDERCAAFLALGLARGSGRPVAVLCTSGTAAAHWYPAVIEASQSRVPLILLSADRPPDLQDWGANQTINQLHLFGHHVRAFHQPAPSTSDRGGKSVCALAAKAVQQSLWPLPGPVHLNVPFYEPLVPDPLPEAPPPCPLVGLAQPTVHPPAQQMERVAAMLSGGRGLIVCGGGDDAKSFVTSLTQLAATLSVPILADPLSGLRFGPHDRSTVLTRYDAFLRRASMKVLQPDWVIRFGAFPISKTLSGFLEQVEGPHIVVDPWGRWPDPLHQTTELIQGSPNEVCVALNALQPRPAPTTWLQRLREEEERAARLATEHARRGLVESSLISQLIETLPCEATLFCGNSMAIRDIDSFSGSAAKTVKLVANRGASGIDGNVSTALGIAASQIRPVAALLGDLALYHDMNGLLYARDVDAVLIVLNNGGGGIFSYLPQSGLERFEEGWLTPTDLDLESVARLYQLHYRRIASPADFRPALETAFGQSGTTLIEVMIDRNKSVARHHDYWRVVEAD